MKRFVILLAICLIAVSPVFAGEMLDAMHITPVSEDTIMSVGGIEFNIPAGYGEDGLDSVDGEHEIVNDIDMINYERVYKNEDLDMIFIHISYDELQSFTLDIIDFGDEKRTINNVTGFYSNEESLHTFSYVVDGKSVRVSAPSEDVLEKVIV